MYPVTAIRAKQQGLRGILKKAPDVTLESCIDFSMRVGAKVTLLNTTLKYVPSDGLCTKSAIGRGHAAKLLSRTGRVIWS